MSTASVSATFMRSERLLADLSVQQRGWFSLAVVLLLGAWAWWFFFASIAVYEVSHSARTEVVSYAHVINAPVDARIVRNHFELDQTVEEDDVLVEFDDRAQRLELAEFRTRLAAIEPQLALLERLIESEGESLAAANAARTVAQEEIRVVLAGSESLATQTERNAARTESLRDRGFVTDNEAQWQSAQAQEARASAEQLRLSLQRNALDQRADAADRQARIDRLKLEARALEGESAILASTIDRLAYEVDLRRVRSPVSGRVVELIPLPPGSNVEFGDRLGTVLPEGPLHVVAFFPPSVALGRIVPGQQARVVLDAFPRSQYGFLAAEVSHVAREAQNRFVRVDLAIKDSRESTIALDHGQPGRVDVWVESVSPAVLALRAAGMFTERPVRASVATENSG